MEKQGPNSDKTQILKFKLNSKFKDQESIELTQRLDQILGEDDLLEKLNSDYKSFKEKLIVKTSVKKQTNNEADRNNNQSSFPDRKNLTGAFHFSTEEIIFSINEQFKEFEKINKELSYYLDEINSYTSKE